MTRTRSAKTFQQKFSLAGECLLVSSAIINTHYWELRRRKFCREIREYILQSLPFSVTISSWTFLQAPPTIIWGWSSGLSVKTLPVVQRYGSLCCTKSLLRVCKLLTPQPWTSSRVIWDLPNVPVQESATSVDMHVCVS